MIDFEKILKKTAFYSKPISIIVYLYEHSDPNGCVIASYKKIQEATRTSAPTVAKVMTNLQKCGAIRKIQNGVWQFAESEEDPETYSIFG